MARDALATVATGAACGLVLSFAAAPFLRSLLFGMGAFDARTYTIVPAALVLVGGLAAWAPTRRAGAADVAGTLRGG